MAGKIVMLATLQSSKYFFHSGQIGSQSSRLSRSTELSYRRAAELHEALPVPHFIKTVCGFNCDPHSGSLPQPSHFLISVKPCSYEIFGSLNQIMCKF
jgi:hypothetical protein